MQLLHATIACMCAEIIAGFPTCQKIFMMQKCCSQLQCFVQTRDNDVDVDLCDVTVTGFRYYIILTFRKYRKLK